MAPKLSEKSSMASTFDSNKRAMAGLVVEGFLTRFCFGIVSFALPLYAYSLGMSIAAIGVLVSVNLGVSALGKTVLAGVVDRIGYRRAAVIATLLRVVVLALLLVATAPWALFAIQILRGLAKSIRDPALNALIACYGGSRTLGSAFAWYGTAKSVAISLGKAVAGVLLAILGGAHGLVFALVLIPAAITVLPLLRWVDEVRVIGDDAGKPTNESALDHRRTIEIARELGPLLGFGFAVSATGRMLRGLLPLLAIEYAGLSVAAAGGLYLVGAVTMLVGGPVFGWLSDNVSRKLVLATRGLANSTSSLLYALFPTFLGFNVAKAIDSLGKAAFKPAWGVLMAESASSRADSRARVMAVMSASRDVGTVVGPIIGGILWTLFGPVTLLLTRAALALGTEVFVFAVRKRGSSPHHDLHSERSL